MAKGNVEVKSRGGGYFNHLKPKFSTCEKSLYVAMKNSVLQYSVNTGLLLAEYKDLKKPIVGFDITYFGSVENLVACCDDGTIAVWKTVTRFKTILNKIKCSNVKSFHCLPNRQEDDSARAVITYSQSGRNCVAVVNIEKGTFKNFKLKLKGKQICVGNGNKKFFAIADKRKLYFVSVDNTEIVKSVMLGSKTQPQYFTSLECHPIEEIVITGDSEGKVILWHDIFGNFPARSIYHWHTLPVNCLAFSAVGSYFYSGGNESVLVRWDWENSNNKKFLPRLPGYIQQIGISNQSQILALSTSDNAVKIIDSAFNNISSIHHLVVGDNYECGIALDPRTKALIMNGSVGQLQFYQQKNNTLLYTMDIVGQNKLSNERNFSVENTLVSKFAINKSGLCLATVEQRQGTMSNYSEMRLKFWHFDSSCQIFELNTSIEKPHEKSVLSIGFQPSDCDQELKCVTLGEDKKFKVWHRIVIQQLNVDRTVWNYLIVGFYRDLPCKGLSFSTDGSLMGIGFGPMLTAWTPDTCEIKCSLVYPGHKDFIENIQFGTNNHCHLVVTTTKSRLSVWNLLTLTIIWTVPIEIEYLLSEKLCSYMAVITKKKEFFIFSPSSPTTVYSNSEILSTRNIMSAAIIPTQSCLDNQSKWYERMELYLIDSNKELLSIGVESCAEDSLVPDTQEDISLSLYNQMMPYKKVSSTSIEHRKHLFESDLTHNNLKKYLAAPIHTMVPIRLTCASLIRSYLIKKNSVNLAHEI